NPPKNRLLFFIGLLLSPLMRTLFNLDILSIFNVQDIIQTHSCQQRKLVLNTPSVTGPKV
ncbi:MAG: hypothetical protein WCO26_12990, partial [Deltaproteobacteria bacterium]